MLEIGIASDNAPENLSDFELILQISPISATGASSLSFVNPQSEAFLADTDYIFAGSSESIADGLSTVTFDSATQITFIDVSSDFVGDFLDVPVTGNHLLASIDLQHNLGGTAAGLTAGDQYEVRVGLLSGFFQASGDEVDFFSNSGIVTVSAVAIPEPSFCAALLAGCCGLVVQRRRRR